MNNDYFVSLENLNRGEQQSLTQVLDRLSFNASGLIPVITQDQNSRDVLMLAWMNRESIEQTLLSGDMTYWSRSRSRLWRKGETSGHLQRLKTMRIDCDGDTLLCDVDQIGAACHTGRRTCFYLQLDTDANSVTITGSIPEHPL